MTAWRIRLALTFVSSALLAGCQSGGSERDWSAQALARPAGGDRPTVVVVNSAGSLVPGQHRLAVGLFTAEGSMVHDAALTARLYRLNGDTGEFVREITLQRSQLPGEGEHPHDASGAQLHNADVAPLVTVYVAPVEFDRASDWGLDVSGRIDGKSVKGLRARFPVLATSIIPAVGAAVPASEQRTLRDVKDITQIDSSNQPDPELHAETLKEALATGQPIVLAVATPRFCQTRFCGPVLEGAVLPVWRQHRGKVRVLHVEPFDLAKANAGQLEAVPMMSQWGLQTEPWVFVIDGQGKMAARFEGVVTSGEISAVLDRLLR